MKNNNLIAICGRKQHGKDLVANIIQYLTTYGNYNSLDSFINRSPKNAGTPYEIKKFADTLKDIVCLLIGCTRDDLESEEFKNKELGEEWTIYKLHDGNMFRVISKDVFDSLPKDVQKSKTVTIESLTPRKMLQYIGTDLFVNKLHPNTWINTTFTKYKESKPTIHSGLFTDENCYQHSSCTNCGKSFYGYKRQFMCKDCHEIYNWFPKWIISDCRFPNEAKAVKDRGGIIIKIERPDIVSNDNHASETSVDLVEYDELIVNSGSIEDLIDKVKQILIKYKIL